MPLKQKHADADAGEKASNRADMEMLVLEIEKNRIQMQLAWHKASVLNCPIRTLEHSLEKPESETPQSSPRKKSR